MKRFRPQFQPLIKVYEKLNLINFFTTLPPDPFPEMNFYCSFASMLFTFEMKFYDVWMNIEHKWRVEKWKEKLLVVRSPLHLCRDPIWWNILVSTNFIYSSEIFPQTTYWECYWVFHIIIQCNDDELRSKSS